MTDTPARTGDRLLRRGRAFSGPGAEAAAAFALLTRLPVPRRLVGTDRTGAAWFPLVGLVVGAAAGVPLILVAEVDRTLAALLALATAAVLTGVLHLDGLADTADALLAPDPGRAEAARTDPRIGVGGAAALLLVMGVQAAALGAALGSTASERAAVGAAAVLAASRLVPVLLARIAPSRPAGAGFGAWFASRVTQPSAVIALGLAFAVAIGAAVLVGGPVPLVSSVATVVLGLAIAGGVTALRGGLDGDVLGASVELATTVGLVTLAAAGTAGAW